MSKRATKKFFGPAASNSERIDERTPLIIALIHMTVATPTTMPRIVRIVRNRF